jgi:hypothetical protein
VSTGTDDVAAPTEVEVGTAVVVDARVVDVALASLVDVVAPDAAVLESPAEPPVLQAATSSSRLASLSRIWFP